MKASVKRAGSLLVSAVLLISSALAYGAFVRPLYDEATLLRGKLFAAQQLFTEKEQAVNKVTGLIKEYQGAGSLEDAVSLALPPHESVSSVFNQLQAIASSHSLTLQVFNVELLPVKPARSASLVRPLGTLRISLKATGGYEALKNFVKSMETNIRVMDLVRVKVEPAGQGSSFLTYTIVADTYYQAQ